MSRELKRQLNSMKHEAVKPNAEWVAKNRSLLLSQIKNTIPQKVQVSFNTRFEAVLAILMPESLVSGTVRFVAISLIVVMVAPSLYYGTVMASQESLPGENLYGAKRYAEKIQVTVVGLIGNTSDETKLHVELAKKRADETSKIINDPSKMSNVANTVADLRSEMNTISDKLDQSKNSGTMSAGDAQNIKQNTDQIKEVLQVAKNDLMAVSAGNDRTLNEVKQTKDLVQDVSMQAVEVMVTKHLEGDTSVSKAEVKAAIDSTVQTSVGEVAQSRENIAGMQTILQTAKSDVGGLVNDFKGSAMSSTTQEITNKIAVVYDKANQAVQVTDTISEEAGRKAVEVKALLGSDNLAGAVDRMKELSQASKDIETISDKTIEQTQPLIPIVQVVKDVVASGTTSSIDIVSSSVKLLTIDAIISTGTINTTSLTTLPLPKYPTSTISTTPKVQSSTPPISTH
ncbi:MAG: hypothetical protein WCT43_02100 [Candidatus Magasanikbacteria bacterium]